MRQNWSLFIIFLRREFTGQYLGSVTSVGWALIAPLVMLAIYGYVFGEIFKVRFLKPTPSVSWVTWRWVCGPGSLFQNP